jgi:hypothetical protein
MRLGGRVWGLLVGYELLLEDLLTVEEREWRWMEIGYRDLDRLNVASISNSPAER